MLQLIHEEGGIIFMEDYQALEMEVIEFDTEDVITASDIPLDPVD